MVVTIQPSDAQPYGVLGLADYASRRGQLIRILKGVIYLTTNRCLRMQNVSAKSLAEKSFFKAHRSERSIFLLLLFAAEKNRLLCCLRLKITPVASLDSIYWSTCPSKALLCPSKMIKSRRTSTAVLIWSPSGGGLCPSSA